MKTKKVVVVDSRNCVDQCYYRVITYTAIRGRWFRVGESSPIPRYVYLSNSRLQELAWGYLDGKPAE